MHVETVAFEVDFSCVSRIVFCGGKLHLKRECQIIRYVWIVQIGDIPQFGRGCNVVSFGEMGIGNTSPSSIWMHLLTGISLEQCVGAGSGLDSEGIRHKYNVLKQSVNHYTGNGSVKDIIAWFGGYEMVMAIGGMLRAAELRMIILVDGFIMTNCILAASKLHPEVLSYAIFGHQGDEIGHKLVLDAMKVRPLLNLGLRLGEGTGAICAYPIVVSSVNMMNEMDNFAHAAITKYF